MTLIRAAIAWLLVVSGSPLLLAGVKLYTLAHRVDPLSAEEQRRLFEAINGLK